MKNATVTEQTTINFRQAIRQAIGREIGRMIQPSKELEQARLAMDQATSVYRDLIREEARKALERY